MVELARSIVSRLRQFVGDRRRAKRINVRLAFSISLAGPAVSSNGTKRIRSLKGHTLDVSATGMALVVPSIIVGEHHLIGENRNLNVTLELPDGPIELQVAPIRYESLDEHETETGYLVGTKIIRVAEGDQTRFNEYILQLLHS
jgi:c-di-GMP-binding flagellar brake protein YcgR